MPRNRGKPKPRIADLTPIELTAEEAITLTRAFSNAPPIPTAILGGIAVEHELEVIIRQKLPKVDNITWAELTSDIGPLRTFHAKIAMGSALRLYDDATKKNLHVVRTIRNAFAHSKKILSFEHELVVHELGNVKVPNHNKRIYRKIKGLEYHSNKIAFIMLCLTLQNKFLRMQSAKLKRAKPKGLVPFGVLLGDLSLAKLGNQVLPPSRLPVSQTGDPTSQAPQGLLNGLFRLGENLASKQDK